MRGTFDAVLDVPVGRCFPYLADPRNRPQWQSSLARVRDVTPGPPRVGTRWTDVLRGGLTAQLEIVEMLPGLLWTEQSSGGPLRGTVEVRFLDRGPRTALRVTVEGALPGPAATAALSDALVWPLVRAGFRADLRSLERQLRALG